MFTFQLSNMKDKQIRLNIVLQEKLFLVVFFKISQAQMTIRNMNWNLFFQVVHVEKSVAPILQISQAQNVRQCTLLGSVSSQQRFEVTDIKALSTSQLLGLGQTVLQLSGLKQTVLQLLDKSVLHLYFTQKIAGKSIFEV